MKKISRGHSDFGKLCNAYAKGGKLVLTHASSVIKAQETLITEAKNVGDELYQALGKANIELIDEPTAEVAMTLYQNTEERLAGIIAAAKAMQRGNKSVMLARFPEKMCRKPNPVHVERDRY